MSSVAIFFPVNEELNNKKYIFRSKLPIFLAAIARRLHTLAVAYAKENLVLSRSVSVVHDLQMGVCAALQAVLETTLGQCTYTRCSPGENVCELRFGSTNAFFVSEIPCWVSEKRTASEENLERVRSGKGFTRARRTKNTINDVPSTQRSCAESWIDFQQCHLIPYALHELEGIMVFDAGMSVNSVLNYILPARALIMTIIAQKNVVFITAL